MTIGTSPWMFLAGQNHLAGEFSIAPCLMTGYAPNIPIPSESTCTTRLLGSTPMATSCSDSCTSGPRCAKCGAWAPPFQAGELTPFLMWFHNWVKLCSLDFYMQQCVYYKTSIWLTCSSGSNTNKLLYSSNGTR